jgi:hypothetical protein
VYVYTQNKKMGSKELHSDGKSTPNARLKIIPACTRYN